MDYSPPGSSVHGISQARILEWVAISSSRGSSWPRDQNLCLLHCRRILYLLTHRGLSPEFGEHSKPPVNLSKSQDRAGPPWGKPCIYSRLRFLTFSQLPRVRTPSGSYSNSRISHLSFFFLIAQHLLDQKQKKILRLSNLHLWSSNLELHQRTPWPSRKECFEQAAELFFQEKMSVNKRQVWKSKVFSMATESTDEITSVPGGLKGGLFGFHWASCCSYLLLIPSWISFYRCRKKIITNWTAKNHTRLSSHSSVG